MKFKTSGKTAAESGLSAAAHEAGLRASGAEYDVYESITNSPVGKPNFFVTRFGKPGELTLGREFTGGPGVFTYAGDHAGIWGTGMQIVSDIDPKATDGTDFVFNALGEMLWINNALTIRRERIDVSYPQYLKYLKDGTALPNLRAPPSGAFLAILRVRLHNQLSSFRRSLSQEDKTKLLDEIQVELNKVDARAPYLIEAATLIPELIPSQMLDRILNLGRSRGAKADSLRFLIDSFARTHPDQAQQQFVDKMRYVQKTDELSKRIETILSDGSAVRASLPKHVQFKELSELDNADPDVVLSSFVSGAASAFQRGEVDFNNPEVVAGLRDVLEHKLIHLSGPARERAYDFLGVLLRSGDFRKNLGVAKDLMRIAASEGLAYRVRSAKPEELQPLINKLSQDPEAVKILLQTDLNSPLREGVYQALDSVITSGRSLSAEQKEELEKLAALEKRSYEVRASRSHVNTDSSAPISHLNPAVIQVADCVVSQLKSELDE